MSSILDSLLWLSADSDPSSPKHRTSWKHPLLACFIHYVTVAVAINVIHDLVILPCIKNYILSDPLDFENNPQLTCSVKWSKEREWSARVAFLYVMILLSTRLLQSKSGVYRLSVLYEFTWLCNSALLFGAYGLYSCRPLIAAGFAVAISIDQILWYVDMVGYIFSGFKLFPVGVCKYLLWPQTQWITRLTCTHHFWTIPLLLYGCCGLNLFGAYIFNIVLVFLHVLLSRWLSPFRIALDDDNNKVKDKYLNVNLGK